MDAVAISAFAIGIARSDDHAPFTGTAGAPSMQTDPARSESRVACSVPLPKAASLEA